MVDRLRENAADREPRIQAGIRILKDDLHAPAQRPHLAARQTDDLLPFELDAAARRLNQLQDAAARRRLAAAALADQAEHFSGVHVERDPVDAP